MNEKSFDIRMKGLKVFVMCLNYLQIVILPVVMYYLPREQGWLIFMVGIVLGIKLGGLVDHFKEYLGEIAHQNAHAGAEESAKAFIADVKKVFGANGESSEEARKN